MSPVLSQQILCNFARPARAPIKGANRKRSVGSVRPVSPSGILAADLSGRPRPAQVGFGHKQRERVGHDLDGRREMACIYSIDLYIDALVLWMQQVDPAGPKRGNSGQSRRALQGHSSEVLQIAQRTAAL